MKGKIAVATGLAFALTALSAPAATKAPGKAPPACAAITFRPLPPGMSDGEQEAGMYRSRNGRLELRAEVKQGTPSNYFVTTGGKRIAAAPPSLPAVVASCAALKKMPKPDAPASSCIGQHFKVVVAHAGEQRFALLYAQDASAWHFCSAGSF
jgi:hypothetical protein